MSKNRSKKIRQLKKNFKINMKNIDKNDIKNISRRMAKLIKFKVIRLDQLQEFIEVAKLNDEEIAKLQKMWNDNNPDELWE